MAEKRMLLIVNPVSGTLDSRNALYDILTPFCGDGWSVTVALTQRRGHAKELAQAASENGYKAIVCCGGDGTLNETLTGMMLSQSKELPVGYIPAGSTNDFAATLGLTQGPRLTAETISRMHLMPIDVGRFGEDRYFSYIASFGAVTQASYSAPQDLKNIVGHMAYLLEGIKDLSSLRPCRAEVISGERRCSGDYIFGCISNTRSVGGIVKLKDADIDLDDGLFEVILVKNPKTAGDLSEIISGVMRGDFSSPIFEFFKTAKAEFRFAGELTWSLDGEKVVSPASVVAENIHKAVKLML